MKLSDAELESLMDKLQIPWQGREMVRNIRASEPSRVVSSRKSNVTHRYPSLKMGLTIQAESENEMGAVYQWEHDDVTFEFYDQCPQIKLTYKDRNGRNRGSLTRPDYFIIQRDFIGWVECKTEADLEEALEQGGNRIRRDASGIWHLIPGEEYASRFGLGFRLRSSAENPPIYLRNLAFLSDYWKHRDSKVLPDECRQQIDDALADRGWCTLLELIEKFDESTVNNVYISIVQEYVYVDLYKNALADLKHNRIYRSKAFHDALVEQHKWERAGRPEPLLRADTLARKGWVSARLDGVDILVVHEADDCTVFKMRNGEPLIVDGPTIAGYVKCGRLTDIGYTGEAKSAPTADILKKAKDSDLALATTRVAILKKLESGGKNVTSSVSLRTIRRWKKRCAEGAAHFGMAYLGLIPKTSRRGNRNCRLDEDVVKLMEEVFEKAIEEPSKLTPAEMWGTIRVECEARGLEPPGEKTCRIHFRRWKSRYEILFKTKGKRAAYKAKPATYMLIDRETPMHGDRPFEIAHIDHTKADVEVVDEETRKNLGRPWLTVMLDAFTRAVLAFILSFDPVDKMRSLAILGECLRIHGYKPLKVVIDGGSDFRSIRFEDALAALTIDKVTRPIGESRNGNVIERNFDTTNQNFFHTLIGSTEDMKNPRNVSSSHKPKKRAIWTLRALNDAIGRYFFETYNGELVHPAHGMTPNEMMRIGFELSGRRDERCLPFTENVRIFLLPSTRTGKTTIHADKGARLRGKFYICEAMKIPKNDGRICDVRYDPDRPIGYIHIDGDWHQCWPVDKYRYQGKSDYEIELMMKQEKAEQRSEWQQRASNADIRAREAKVRSEKESDLLQEKLDRQAQDAAQRPPAPPPTGSPNNTAHDSDGSHDDDWENLDVPKFGEF
ncbi:MAG TPA: hypothetical protein VIF60_00870 [Burkholderiaceae bacterium]